MTAFLLDVNVLIALMRPAHESHEEAQRWFGRNSQEGWATCPLTQAAFVRIVTNPAFSTDAVTPQEAVKILAANVKHPSHLFWGDEISFVQAVEPFARRLAGHKQSPMRICWDSPFTRRESSRLWIVPSAPCCRRRAPSALSWR